MMDTLLNTVAIIWTQECDLVLMLLVTAANVTQGWLGDQWTTVLRIWPPDAAVVAVHYGPVSEGVAAQWPSRLHAR